MQLSFCFLVAFSYHIVFLLHHNLVCFAHDVFDLDVEDIIAVFDLKEESQELRTLNAKDNRLSKNNLLLELEYAFAVVANKPRREIFFAGIGKSARREIEGPKGIWRLFDNGTRPLKPELLPLSATVPMECLAVDWINLKLYWINAVHSYVSGDALSYRLEVSELDGTNWSVLAHKDIVNPKSLVLDTKMSYLYFICQDDDNRIERIGLDGTERQLLVDKGLQLPITLSIDSESQILYWVDLMENEKAKIEALDLLSEPRRRWIVIEKLSSPISLSFSRGWLYWVDHFVSGILGCLARDCQKQQVIIPLGERLHLLTPYFNPLPNDTFVQRWNPCAVDNRGGCSHLCLLSPLHTYTCACPTGILINNDQRTCASGFGQILLVTRTIDIRLISLDTNDHTDQLLPLFDMQNAAAIAWDPVEKRLYWSDNCEKCRKVIRSASLNGSDDKIVIGTELANCDGIAIDWVARNIYWTDGQLCRIEVARLDADSRRVVISTDLLAPRGIVVDPIRGYLFFSDWELSRIEWCYLDGSHRKIFIQLEKGTWPNALALDRKNNRLFWLDTTNGRIESASVGPNAVQNRIELYRKPGANLFAMTLLDNYLFVIDRTGRQLIRVNKDRENPSSDIAMMPDMHGLVAVDLKMKHDEVNECSIGNGGCSHLCLYVPRGHRCSCPFGMELSSDNRSCLDIASYLLFTTSSEINIGRITLSSAGENNSELSLRDWTYLPLSSSSGQKLRNHHFLAIDHRSERVFWSESIPIEFQSPYHSLRYSSFPHAQRILSAYFNGSGVKIECDAGISQIEGMAVDEISQQLYWADSSYHHIEVKSLRTHARSIILYKEVRPRALAISSTHGFLFFSDWFSDSGSIERSDLDGDKNWNEMQAGRRHISLITNVKVFYLIVDPLINVLYYSAEDNQISMIDFEGNNRKRLIERENAQPFLLALHKDHLIWSEFVPTELDLVDYDDLLADSDNDAATTTMSSIWRGSKSSRRRRPIGSSGKSRKKENEAVLMSCLRTNLTSANVKQLSPLKENFLSMAVVDLSAKLGWNPCGANKCKHLCFAIHTSIHENVDLPSSIIGAHSSINNSGNGNSDRLIDDCACATHFDINERGECSPPQKFLLFVQPHGISRLKIDVEQRRQYPIQPLPIQLPSGARTLTYDSFLRKIYFFDNKLRSVRISGENYGEQVDDLRFGANAFVNYMAIDSISRIMYWSCLKYNTINITRLPSVPSSNNADSDDLKSNFDSGNPKTLKIEHLGAVVASNGLESYHPTMIQINVLKNFLFFVDTALANCRIIRCHLDGSECNPVVTKLTVEPSAFVIDHIDIFWAEKHIIFFINEDGIGQANIIQIPQTVQSNIRKSIIGLAVLGEFIYWIYEDSQRVFMVDKGGHEFSSISERFSRLTSILAVDIPSTSMLGDNHPCLNMRCSHLCIVSSEARGYHCACPPDMVLDSNARHECMPRVRCLSYQLQCASGLTCYAAASRCDGISDCTDRSDELDCNDCQSKHTERLWRCLAQKKENECIPRNKLCDGHRDCLDGSDENYCHCDASLFHCKKDELDTCISREKVCDGHFDCDDKTDELYCRTRQKISPDIPVPYDSANGNSNLSLILAVLGTCALLLLIVIVVWWCFRLRISRLNRLQPPSVQLNVGLQQNNGKLMPDTANLVSGNNNNQKINTQVRLDVGVGVASYYPVTPSAIGWHPHTKMDTASDVSDGNYHRSNLTGRSSSGADSSDSNLNFCNFANGNSSYRNPPPSRASSYVPDHPSTSFNSNTPHHRSTQHKHRPVRRFARVRYSGCNRNDNRVTAEVYIDDDNSSDHLSLPMYSHSHKNNRRELYQAAIKETPPPPYTPCSTEVNADSSDYFGSSITGLPVISTTLPPDPPPNSPRRKRRRFRNQDNNLHVQAKNYESETSEALLPGYEQHTNERRDPPPSPTGSYDGAIRFSNPQL